MNPDIILMHLGKLAKEVNNIGISATVNPNRVSIPGAWVALKELEIESMARGEVTAEASVYLVAADLGTTLAVEYLMGMLDDLLNLLETRYPLGIEITTITLPAIGQTPLPAVEVTYELKGT